MGELRRLDFHTPPEKVKIIEANREGKKEDALDIIRPILQLLNQKLEREFYIGRGENEAAAYAKLPPCLHGAYRAGNIFRDIDRWVMQFKYVGLLGNFLKRLELDILYNTDVDNDEQGRQSAGGAKETIVDNFEPSFIAELFTTISRTDESNTFFQSIRRKTQEQGKIFEIRLGALGIKPEDLVAQDDGLE